MAVMSKKCYYSHTPKCTYSYFFYFSPKDLGTHILQKHCEATNETVTITSDKKEAKEEAIIEEEKTLVMDVDPLDHHRDNKSIEHQQESNSDIATTQCLDDTILPVLPRSPSLEEQKQKFLMYHLQTDPPNFMR